MKNSSKKNPVTADPEFVKPKNIFFSGMIYSHKDLVGNLYLSKAIKTMSKGRYKVILQQDLQGIETDPLVIKNSNLTSIRKMDGILISFDGTELDSGTVVEFITAKLLDKPAVIMRTDFRAGGEADSNERMDHSDPWNLMCSNYPRTETVSHDAIIMLYQNMVKKYCDDFNRIAQDLTYLVAELIINKLDAAFGQAPVEMPQGMTRNMLEKWYSKMFTPQVIFLLLIKIGLR